MLDPNVPAPRMEKQDKKHSYHHQYISMAGTIARPKYTTRHLAALDFLLNIPMSKEAAIRQQGITNMMKMQELEDREIYEGKSDDDDESVERTPNTNLLSSMVPVPSSHLTEDVALPTEIAGKKLQGPYAVVVKYPLTFRYFLMKLTEQSALCRQWEEKLLTSTKDVSGKGSGLVQQQSQASSSTIVTSRLFFSRLRSYPIMVSSVIKYDAGEEKAKLKKMIADDQKGMEVFDLPHRDWRGFSYKPLFKQLKEERANDYFFEKGFLYDPVSLDDPNMLYGSHRYVLQRSERTGPILSSIILYVNKRELKETLNEQFHERHENLPPSLTLSKIRNIKKEMLRFAMKIGIELSSVAIAFINFERLCLKSLVTKFNRKLSMAVSMLLAYKFNESASNAKYRRVIDLLLDFCDKEWDLPKKQIFEAEFGAYVHLGFVMHIPYRHVHEMYMRLLKLLNRTSAAYLTEEMQEIYEQDIINLEREIEAIKQEKERLQELEEQAGQEEGNGSADSDNNANEIIPPDDNDPQNLSEQESSKKHKKPTTFLPFKLFEKQLTSKKPAPEKSVGIDNKSVMNDHGSNNNSDESSITANNTLANVNSNENMSSLNSPAIKSNNLTRTTSKLIVGLRFSLLSASTTSNNTGDFGSTNPEHIPESQPSSVTHHDASLLNRATPDNSSADHRASGSEESGLNN